jgi:Holliday junction resolvase RusA-like endonuclease
MLEKCLTLEISGQIRGGKNNYLVLRNGMHVPRKEWAKWRDAVVLDLKTQSKGLIFDSPCSISVHYWPGDKRRRDVPGMADALCHCLERSGIVSDDCLLTDWVWTFEVLDRAKPRVDITITAKNAPGGQHD